MRCFRPVLAGLLLTFLGFLDLIRNDARRATVRVTGQISRTPDQRLGIRPAHDEQRR